MKIYINESLVENANILGSETEVLDETLDTLSFGVLDDSPNPYNPMTNVKITEDDENFLHFVVTSDSVEPYSLIRGFYKHSLVCVESTRKLSKHLVRNSVFAQPPSRWKSGWNFSCEVATTNSGDGSEGNPYNYGFMRGQFAQDYGASEPLTLGTREKCGKTYVRINVQVAVANANSRTLATSVNDCKTLNDINAQTGAVGEITQPFSIVILYELNGVQQSEELTPSMVGGGTIYYNTDLECPRIAEIIKAGGTKVRVEPEAALLFGGTQYPAQKHIEAIFWQIEVKAEVYYFSCADVLLLLERRQRKARTQDGELYREASLFSLPDSGELRELLEGTIAPNFTFTQCSMYEAVAEVFRVFDAIFTMDGNGVLGIAYFNDRNGSKVTANPTGINVALGEERFVNGMVAYYQDAIIEEQFPTEGSYAHARSNAIGIPQEGDHCFLLPKPIELVTKATLRCGIVVRTSATGQTYNNELAVTNFPLDITRYVVEKSIWSSVLSSTDVIQTTDPSVLVQNNTVFYTKGESSIELAYASQSRWNLTYYSFANMANCAAWRFFGFRNVIGYNAVAGFNSYGTSGIDWTKVQMQVNYAASIDGRLKIESTKNKYEGDIIIDQVNGAVDLGNLGANMLGLSYKMGEPSLGFSHKPTSWANRIKKGDIYEWQGEEWVANACNYTILGNGYFAGKISFVKNYNELSMRKRLLMEKRLSNVSRQLTVKSEDNIVEFMYFSRYSQSFVGTGGFGHTIFSKNYYPYCFVKSFGLDTYQYITTIDYAVFKADETIYIPCVRYGAGNAVHFEMSFDDPMSAGIKTESSPESGWFGAVSYYSSYVIYPNADGFLNNADIYIGCDSQEDFDDDFPEVPSPVQSRRVLEIRDLMIYKQPNEIFALNYSISFMPMRQAEEFVGRAFIENNFFVNGKPLPKKLYIHYSNAELYSVLDTKGLGSRVSVSEVSLGDESYCHYAELRHETIQNYATTKSWSICDEDGNILFAFNSPVGANYCYVYFKLSPHRL